MITTAPQFAPPALRKPLSRRRELFRFGGLLFLWALLVCYPNPFIIVRNLVRYASFPIDPSIIRIFPLPVPDQPAKIEELVLSYVRYRSDWELYDVPWYVPSPEEAIRDRAGDCESRAFLLASLLAAKGIPYRIEASPVHMWVDYPGKAPNPLENAREAYIQKVDGRWLFRLPNWAEWRFYLTSQKEVWWDIMPPLRKALLILGWGLIILTRLRIALSQSP